MRLKLLFTLLIIVAAIITSVIKPLAQTQSTAISVVWQSVDTQYSYNQICSGENGGIFAIGAGASGAGASRLILFRPGYAPASTTLDIGLEGIVFLPNHIGVVGFVFTNPSIKRVLCFTYGLSNLGWVGELDLYFAGFVADRIAAYVGTSLRLYSCPDLNYIARTLSLGSGQSLRAVAVTGNSTYIVVAASVHDSASGVVRPAYAIASYSASTITLNVIAHGSNVNVLIPYMEGDRIIFAYVDSANNLLIHVRDFNGNLITSQSIRGYGIALGTQYIPIGSVSRDLIIFRGGDNAIHIYKGGVIYRVNAIATHSIYSFGATSPRIGSLYISPGAAGYLTISEPQPTTITSLTTTTLLLTETSTVTEIFTVTEVLVSTTTATTTTTTTMVSTITEITTKLETVTTTIKETNTVTQYQTTTQTQTAIVPVPIPITVTVTTTTLVEVGQTIPISLIVVILIVIAMIITLVFSKTQR